MTYKNFPLEECNATLLKIKGDDPTITFYQKWTCGQCGERVTLNEPNILAEQAHHEDCGYVTDIRKTGCNYALRIVLGGRPAAKGGDQMK